MCCHFIGVLFQIVAYCMRRCTFAYCMVFNRTPICFQFVPQIQGILFSFKERYTINFEFSVTIENRESHRVCSPFYCSLFFTHNKTRHEQSETYARTYINVHVGTCLSTANESRMNSFLSFLSFIHFLYDNDVMMIQLQSF